MQFVFLGIAALFGVLCWQRARAFENYYRQGVWGMPAWLWGFLGFMFGLIGFLVFYVAEKRATRAAESKKRSSPPPPQWPPRVEVPATSAWPPAPPSAP